MNWEEKLLILVIGSISVAMLVGSFNYSTTEAFMPRASALLVVFFGCVVIAQEYVLTDDDGGTSLSDRIDRVVDEESDDHFGIEQSTRAYDVPYLGRSTSYRIVVAALLVGYIGAIYLAGLFWPTVIFLGIYCKVMSLDRRSVLVLYAITLFSLYVFGWWLETPLFQSQLDWLLVPGVEQ